MKSIESMGHFTAIGMRTPVDDRNAIVINTCSGNDTIEIGHMRGKAWNWSWSNPTNRIIPHSFYEIRAVSVECLWQGTKIFKGQVEPDQRTLNGEWRRGKAKRPIGAWNGYGEALITDPGHARRMIYIPAYRQLVMHWLKYTLVDLMIAEARKWPGPVYLRDWDTGRGLDQNGPMSHAWVLATFLNTGEFPK